MSDFNLERRIWWSYLKPDLKGLLGESVLLVKKVPSWEEKFHDYSFVVFPAAKAYEGFLKTLFLDMGFITQKAYFGKRFRIGKALNPSLDRRYRKNSVYDRIIDYCGGIELADRMWDTWRDCRNILFHWFPKERNAIDFAEAREKVMRVVVTMDAAYKSCKIGNGKG